MIRSTRTAFRKVLNVKRISGTLAIVLAFASILHATTKGPDAGNYIATDATVYSFTDLAVGGASASVLAGTDDGVALLTLPFPFQFYGNNYTMVCVSSNGLLSFVTSAGSCSPSSDFVNTDLSSTAPPGDLPAILPYWTDLTFQVSGSGAVYYRTQGSPGSRHFIVEWSNAYVSGSPNSVTFEVILSEGTNQILVQYQAVDFGQGNPGSNASLATIGIRDSKGNTSGRQIAWSYDAAVIANNSAILFAPPNSQTSVNTITSVPAGLVVMIDGTSSVTPAVVTWAPNSSHTLAVTTPQTNGGTRYVFGKWSTGEPTPGIAVKATTPGLTYTATFSTQYLLTTSVSPTAGGTVSGAGWYNSAATVSVLATPSFGYALSNFSGDLSGSANPQNIIMTAAKSVVANFKLLPTLTSGNACNGIYGGNFKGTINVSSGQTCTFINGAITGNVQTSGGNLVFSGVQISGNVQISGGATFSIGPSTTIKGNLAIQNLPSASAPGQICGSTISGNLQFDNNGTPVQIGSGSSACAGNVVGGNLEVNNNTGTTAIFNNTVSGNLSDDNNNGATQVFNNSVLKNLQCTSNSTITGGGNTAAQKQGQCTGF